MTATLDIEVARRDNVLRAPAAATGSNRRRHPPGAEPAGRAKSAPNTVWTYADGRAAAAAVKLGASDGMWTELVDAPFAEGTPLITRVAIGAESASATPARTSSPLMAYGATSITVVR